MLPLVCAVIGVTIAAGIAISLIGYLPPFVIGSTVLASVGAGLLYTLTPSTSQARQAGYQILFGAGTGVGIQQAIIGAQSALGEADVAYGTAGVLLVNLVGGAVFISASQNVFLNRISSLAERLPDVDEETLTSGFETVRRLLSPEELDVAIGTYNAGIQQVFLIVVVLSCASVVSWPLLSWKSLKAEPKAPTDGNKEREEAKGQQGLEREREKSRGVKG